jgi:hypothetical protein
MTNSQSVGDREVGVNSLIIQILLTDVDSHAITLLPR